MNEGKGNNLATTVHPREGGRGEERDTNPHITSYEERRERSALRRDGVP